MSGERQPVVFVCATPHGGALASTAALARCASDAGHRVTFIVAADDAYAANRRTVAALVRIERVSTRLGRLAWRLYERRFGRGIPEVIDGVPALRAVDVVGAAKRALVGEAIAPFVVANSVRRLDLGRLIAAAHTIGARVAWYLREESSLAAVADMGAAVDVLVANSRPLADAAANGARTACAYVPSVIGVDDLPEPVERRVLLLVNAVESYGLDEAFAIAAALPERAVVLQESWPLPADQRAALDRRLAALPNVEFRPAGPRSSVYRDAAVVLMPHSAAAVGVNRPRVALEAQHLGIPVIAYDTPGLAAVTASSDLRIALGAPIEEWVRAVRAVDADYAAFSDTARVFAAGELPAPAVVWQQFATVACLS